MSALLTFQVPTGSDSRFFRNFMTEADLNAQLLQMEATMAGAYDDRDGLIWMDGQMVDWRAANVHILTHAMHYASSVFEGERAYTGKIFESRRHSERLS